MPDLLPNAAWEGPWPAQSIVYCTTKSGDSRSGGKGGSDIPKGAVRLNSLGLCSSATQEGARLFD